MTVGFLLVQYSYFPPFQVWLSPAARAFGANMKEPMRLAALKQQLQQLRYDQPLGVESAPLVERLLEDLMASQAKQAELSGLAEKRADELSVAEQHILPVRKENQRLVRENNEVGRARCLRFVPFVL